MGQYKTLNNFANEFSSSTAYSQGQLIMYLGELYKFNQNHPAGSWNSSHVDKVSVSSLDSSIPYLTVAPSTDNNSGRLQIVVLQEAPETYYNGYLYYITSQDETYVTDVKVNNVSVVTDTVANIDLSGYQEALVSGTNIKTINNQSVLGSGNISIVSYHEFDSNWDVTHTTEDFCTSIVNDSSAVAGMTYLGTLRCSDLPGGISQGETVVEIISNGANGKAIRITLSSVTNAPYHWEYERAMVNGSYITPGWKGYQLEITNSNKLNSDLVSDTNQTNKFVTASEKTTWSGKQDALVSGVNIKTINNNSILGSGDIEVSSTTFVDWS